jgi:hypothetical protein
MHSQASYQAAVGAPVECLAMEEQAAIGVVIDRLGGGQICFYQRRSANQ